MIPNWSKMIKWVTYAHLRPIWYLSEPSDVPYSPNQFLGWNFFCCFLQQTGFRDTPPQDLCIMTLPDECGFWNLP